MFEDRLSRDGREKSAAVHPGREVPGEDLGRIISLSDGVFAFALTLLVLGLTVPVVGSGLGPSETSGQLGVLLRNDWTKFLGYVFAFVMIAIWWTVHHRVFRYIERYDYVLMWTNMAVLLEVAVMPFVLQVYTSYIDTQVAVVLFASVQVATGLTINILWRYASAGHRLIDPTLDATEIRYFANRGIIAPLVFAVSIPISFFTVDGAEYFWVAAIVVQRLTARYGVP